MPKFLCFLFFIGLNLYCGLLKAQDPAIEAVPNQPCPEAYDLLKDSKGYIWVAHDLGVSRYDGANFINLHNPQQNSLSMTDLIEDKKGRIWCHNFSGQIFYIDNLELHLLKEYKFEEEQGYPRITICGDELIATSVKGLFVYNLLTGQANYHSIPSGTTTLTKVRNKIVCFSPSGQYSYEAGKPLLKLITDIRLPSHQFINLQNQTLHDTLFVTANPLRQYYKLTLQGNALVVQSASQVSAFINTISVDKHKTWIHTKEYSFTTDASDTIDGMNLSDVITDKQGHRWLSSLKKGLCVRYNAQGMAKLFPSVANEDDIRRLLTEDNNLFIGTANGTLYQLTNYSSLHYLSSIPKKAGAIERLVSIDKHHLLLAASIGLYLYNKTSHELKPLPIPQTVKDITLYNQEIYLATTAGINLIPLKEIENIHLSYSVEGLGNKKTRCRSLAFLQDSLIAAYSDGVYLLHHGAIQPLLYQKAPIYAAKIASVAERVLIGTYSQGLFILENGRLRNLTIKDGLASNSIRDIKTINGLTWLIYSDHFQQLNSSFTGVEDYAFPFSKITSLSDFAVLDHQLYIAAADGVYSMAMTKPLSETNSATYIDKIIANGKDLITGNRLKPFQNYLQFQVSTPFFSPYSNITYQYRIKNSPDSSWQRGSPDQTTFNLVALEPGIYDFEIVAIDDSRNPVSLPAVYRFEIEPPWYKQWTFRICISLLVAGLCFSAIRHYYQERLREQHLEYQKVLAVQTERQRISSEIHDDIGAGLSAIRLQTELTKNKLPEGEIKQEAGKIHAAISELSTKMREVIWSLNTDNDKLDNLLYYLRRQALLLFENSPIQLKVTFPTLDIPDIVVKGEKRRHIYLAVKEALHNCLKHSDAQHCHLSLHVDEETTLHITVADDGKGFALLADDQAGNGLPGMKRRMQQMAGLFEVQSQQRTIVKFIIPLHEKHE